jgi:N,N'-diacetyllegionaminate synthase
MEFKIGNVNCSQNNVTIIAEAGVNHLGRYDLAEDLIRSAAKSGADIIKFQTYKADDLTLKSAPRFWDWEGEQDKEGSQHDSYSLLDSFGEQEHIELARLCKKYNIEFMSTPFSSDAAEMLVRVGVNAFKMASCDITNIPFLKDIASFKIPILLSTGASTIDEIGNAISAIKDVNPNADVCVMQCTLCYPTDYSDAHLNSLNHLKNAFSRNLLGLSDHTLGYHIPLASIALGARVIEKHFTIDKTLPMSADHWLSIDPDELELLCKFSPQILDGLGSNEKKKHPCEDKTHAFARRSIVTTNDISKGQIIDKSSLACKRPGTGISPVYMDRVIGSKALKDIQADSILQETDIKF